MQNLFKALFLLIFLISFPYCERFDYRKPIDAKVDMKLLTEKNNQAMENMKNTKMQDIFDNITIELTDQEKSIVKLLLFVKLRPEKIEFSLENLTISYNKTDNSYKPHYYLKAIEEDPSLEDKIKQVTKQIFQSALHYLKKPDDMYKNESTLEDLVKRLPLRGSDQITLINYVNPFDEDTNDFLKDDNIDVNLNFQDGHITIVFKKTYYSNWLNQKIVQKGFYNYSHNCYETNVNLDLDSIIKIPLDQLIDKNKIQADEQFKIVDTNNISYGNFFYHLLHNDIDPILSILNAMPNQNPSFTFTYINNIDFEISIDYPKVILKFTRNKDKILSDFLKLEVDPNQFTFHAQNYFQATVKLDKNTSSIFSDSTMVNMIERNPEIKEKEAGQQNLTYGNFFYYLRYKNFDPIIPNLNAILNLNQNQNSFFMFTHINDIHVQYVNMTFIFLRDKNKILSDFLKLDLDPNEFTFDGQKHFEATLKLNSNQYPVILDAENVNLIETNPETKEKEASQQNLTYGNFFYYLLKINLSQIQTTLNSLFAKASLITNQKFEFIDVDISTLSYVGGITVTLKRMTALPKLLHTITSTTPDHFFRKKNIYDILKKYIFLPTDYLNTTNGKVMAGHGLAVLNGRITFDKTNLQLQAPLTNLEQIIHTELENGIDYNKTGMTTENGSLLHTLIHNTILKTGNGVQVKVLGASLAAAFAPDVHAIEANIKKIYLINNRLVMTLHASGSSHNIMKWLEIQIQIPNQQIPNQMIDSFGTSLPIEIIPSTFNGVKTQFNDIITLYNELPDYTGDFSESLTNQSTTYPVANKSIDTLGNNPDGKIVRFRVRNITLGLESRTGNHMDEPSALTYNNLINKLFVFDDYFFSTNNVFGTNAITSFKNLKKISNSLAQLYLFRNFTKKVPFNTNLVWICYNANDTISELKNIPYHFFSTDLDPQPSSTQDITFGITSKLSHQ